MEGLRGNGVFRRGVQTMTMERLQKRVKYLSSGYDMRLHRPAFGMCFFMLDELSTLVAGAA